MSLLSFATIFTICFTFSASAFAGDTPYWVASPNRAVIGGDILQTGFGKAATLEDAFFLAEAAAVRRITEECGGFPHRDVKIYDRFHRASRDGQYEAFARAGLTVDDCEHSKHLDDAARKRLTNQRLAENQRRYSELLGIPPDWAQQDTQILNGTTYKVVCAGDGPALDLAREQALQGCQADASQHLTQTIHIKSVNFHQRVESNAVIKNLICDPKKEAVQDHGDHFRVWLLCKFDLKKAEAVSVQEPAKPVPTTTEGIVNRGDLEQVEQPEAGTKPESKVQHSTRSTLSIASVPQCSDLLIQGKHPRRIRCRRNPTVVMIEPDDKSVLVRADGYQPKRIKLGERRPASDEVTVILQAD